MKSISDKRWVVASNAWGGNGNHHQEDFEVEGSDVNHTREHYLGMHHRSHQFTRADVGKTITVYSSPGWTCWTWRTT